MVQKSTNQFSLAYLNIQELSRAYINFFFEPGGIWSEFERGSNVQDLKKASLKLKEKHGDQVMNEFDQLKGLDLRTNTFKGGRDDLILRSSKYKDKKV